MFDEYLDKKRWPNILLAEVACQCTYKDCPYKESEEILKVLDPDILDLFEKVRIEEGNKTLLINSAVRCYRHNLIDVGGVTYSPHVPWALTGPVSHEGEGKKRSYALDLSIMGHYGKPKDLRDVIRRIDKDVRIGWEDYLDFVHIDKAYSHPNMNNEMKSKWNKAGQW